jgi:hypothetical protein
MNIDALIIKIITNAANGSFFLFSSSYLLIIIRDQMREQVSNSEF